MPAEWEMHEATWLAWPHYEPHWPGKFEPIPGVFCNIVHTLQKSENVYICVNDEAAEKTATELLLRTAPQKKDALARVRFFRISTNASWMRDNGPIFVRDQHNHRVITDWIHNAWGGQWPYELDDVVPQKIAPQFGLPVVEPKMVLEGGSIDVNGKGTLLTTEQCLLNPNRNPNMTREQIEERLGEYLGATNILWLKEGVAGDDTSGHIDDIARFSDERTVVCGLEENSKDENYDALKKNFEDLQKMKDQDGKALNIIALPMPDPVVYKNQRLPASYANFYIANTMVIVPTFQDRHDKPALEILAKAFPSREIIGIDCLDLVWGLGTLHCSTQQHPAA